MQANNCHLILIKNYNFIIIIIIIVAFCEIAIWKINHAK